jgi:hypothetical protein
MATTVLFFKDSSPETFLRCACRTDVVATVTLKKTFAPGLPSSSKMLPPDSPAPIDSSTLYKEKPFRAP